MPGIEDILNQLKTWPASKKTAALALLVVSVAGLFLLFSWFQKMDYQVLYSNLSEEDAGRIVQKLQEKKIPYRVESGGTILVSPDRVYDLRLQLAAEGLPQGGGIGFELFDDTSFTMSEFVQKLNYRRALEGELMRTIRSLSEVQQCRVHLVIPERSIFVLNEEEQKASAAVFVSLKPGRVLSESQIQGIVHLVSSSVEGLNPEDVTIIDNRGTLLTKAPDNTLGATTSQIEYQHSYEKNIEAKIISILEPVVGRGKVRARVSATFDFTKSERTEERFDPEGVVVRSEQKTVEKSTSGILGGIPGTGSNLPGRATQQAFSPQAGISQRQNETINYETSKTIRRIIDPPVTLERLTVAILIDGILVSQKESIENAEKYTVRSEEDVKFYEDIVKKAVGFAPERGDEISVVVMPFEDVAEMEGPVEEPTEYLPIILTVLKYLAPVVVAILFFLLVLRPLIRTLTATPPREQRGLPPVQQPPKEIEAQAPPKEITTKEKLIEWASKNPQEAAGVIKSWLAEQ